jgi:catalase
MTDPAATPPRIDPTAAAVSTTETGAPAPSDERSLTLGPDGPILLHDHHFLSQMAHFNRERVPERNVHAKGSGAFGYLEVTEDMSPYTRAAVFQRGTRTEALARFSTVAGEIGSPDTVRDPRGFALKFYTSEGNYDLVGNNTPVFFIRDTMKFPHFIRSQKRLPQSGLQSWEMRWDFWTLNPETSHQVAYLMGDRGIPRSLRHMNGYGSHTYMWVNAASERFWVKYHFHSDQGVEPLLNDEAAAIAGNDPDHHRRDLYNAILAGDAPSWTLKVQIMPYADAVDYHLNPFDLTKVWPHSEYPLRTVGRLVLDRNPENHFAQVEQAAFEPSAIVPGIGFSPDKMLLGRVFAYADTHRYRIGPNYAQLPVNRPKVDVHTYEFDGAMRIDYDKDQPAYAPNSVGGPAVPHDPYADHTWEADGAFMRSAYTLRSSDDDVSQPRSLINDVMDDAERARLAATVASTLADVSAELRERVFEYWRAIDKATGDAVAAATSV